MQSQDGLAGYAPARLALGQSAACAAIRAAARGTGAGGIEFLRDNGPEYTPHRFSPFVRAMGLVPCLTPRRSPESNGLAEAFFGNFKQDYLYQAPLETLDAVAHQLSGWIEHYNREVPYRA